MGGMSGDWDEVDMSKPLVLVDMDGVCADLMTPWLLAYGSRKNRLFTVEDVRNFKMETNAGFDDGVYEFLRRDGVFADLRPIPGAVQALRHLNDTANVYICSTPSRNPASATEKLRWCGRHLPFIHRRRLILCARKDLVRGDYLIEDSPDNVRDWALANPQGKTILIDYPYNACASPSYRTCSYQKPEQAWDEIVAFIDGGGR